MKFFRPPHLYCVTSLPSKTNTDVTDDACGCFVLAAEECDVNQVRLAACVNGGHCYVVTIDGQRQPHCRYNNNNNNTSKTIIQVTEHARSWLSLVWKSHRFLVMIIRADYGFSSYNAVILHESCTVVDQIKSNKFAMQNFVNIYKFLRMWHNVRICDLENAIICGKICDMWVLAKHCIWSAGIPTQWLGTMFCSCADGFSGARCERRDLDSLMQSPMAHSEVKDRDCDEHQCTCTPAEAEHWICHHGGTCVATYIQEWKLSCKYASLMITV